MKCAIKTALNSVCLMILLSGCGGAGGGSNPNPNPGPGPTPAPTSTPTPTTTPTPTPTSTPTPPPVSCEAGDSDGDGLSDCDELSFGTNPDVADTDGDGFNDKEEVENWDRLGGSHLRFNPLVADVPRLYMQQLSKPLVQLFATTEESGQITRGMSDAQSNEVQVTTSRGRTNTHKVEEQHAVGVNAEVKRRGPITSGSVEASYDYEHTDTTTDTSYWNETRVATNRQESEAYYEIIQSETTITTGGEIKLLMGFANDGDVSYTVNGMDIAAYMEDPHQPGKRIPVGTLQYQGDLSFTPQPLGLNATIDPDGLEPYTFVYTADGNPGEISRILQIANKLILKPTNLQLSGERADIDLSLAAANIKSRTAEVIIDFGNNPALPIERFRVAIDTGVGNTLPFDVLMHNHLNFSYEFGSASFNGASSENGLLAVRGQAMSAATNSYWLVAHTFTPAGAPSGSRETRLYNLLAAPYSASDINLARGDVLHLVYITDTDLDGLSDRLEQLNSTDINMADSDQDGLDDALETYGWYTNLASAPCDQGDQTLVFGDPLLVDSDADGNSDKQEFDTCSNPMGELSVDAGQDRVITKGSQFTLSAQSSNYSDYSKVAYHWQQLQGAPLGTLPNTDSIAVTAPQDVDGLLFEVTVTENGLSASDQIRVVVAEDAGAALFVDGDTGHDFNNDGSPELPYKTLGRAVELAQAGEDIYLNTLDGASYTLAETLTLPPDVSLYGGFDGNWLRDAATAPTTIVVNQSVGLSSADSSNDIWISGVSVLAVAPVRGSEHSIAIALSDSGVVTLDKVIAQGGNPTWPSNLSYDTSTDYRSGSSYGVLATNITWLDVLDSTLSAGKGADGIPGKNGRDGNPGDKGSNASGTSGGGGGSGHNGQNGGKGGNANTGFSTAGCTDGNKGGKGGDSGGSPSVTGGGGGAGGDITFYVVVCDPNNLAKDGGSVYTRAASGAAGVPSHNSSAFAGGLFNADFGFSSEHQGAQGWGGAGGGGGGSGMGYNFNAGGGGGGGGEGGEGGIGGFGGRGAGGSFGLLLNNVSYAYVADSQISTAEGGLGGAGGYGGVGGNGGDGGSGSDTGNRKGGNGGKGSPGGYGGAGGGGAGGPCAALLLINDSSLDISTVQLTTGDAGNGSYPNRGQGGWNYGIFQDSSSMLLDSQGLSFTLGASGNDAAAAAEHN